VGNSEKSKPVFPKPLFEKKLPSPKKFLLHHFVAENAASRLHQKYLHVCQWKMRKNPNAFFKNPC